MNAKDLFCYEKYKNKYSKERKLKGFNEGLSEIVNQPTISVDKGKSDLSGDENEATNKKSKVGKEKLTSTQPKAIEKHEEHSKNKKVSQQKERRTSRRSVALQTPPLPELPETRRSSRYSRRSSSRISSIGSSKSDNESIKLDDASDDIEKQVKSRKKSTISHKKFEDTTSNDELNKADVSVDKTEGTTSIDDINKSDKSPEKFEDITTKDDLSKADILPKKSHQAFNLPQDKIEDTSNDNLNKPEKSHKKSKISSKKSKTTPKKSNFASNSVDIPDDIKKSKISPKQMATTCTEVMDITSDNATGAQSCAYLPELVPAASIHYEDISDDDSTVAQSNHSQDNQTTTAVTIQHIPDVQERHRDNESPTQQVKKIRKEIEDEGIPANVVDLQDKSLNPSEEIIVENKIPSHNKDIFPDTKKILSRKSSSKGKSKRLSIEERKLAKFLEKKNKRISAQENLKDSILENINIEIKKSLSAENPKAEVCLDIMYRLKKLNITADMWIKYPDIVQTLRICKRYKNNSTVKSISSEIYDKLKKDIQLYKDNKKDKESTSVSPQVCVDSSSESGNSNMTSLQSVSPLISTLPISSISMSALPTSLSVASLPTSSISTTSLPTSIISTYALSHSSPFSSPSTSVLQTSSPITSAQQTSSPKNSAQISSSCSAVHTSLSSTSGVPSSSFSNSILQRTSLATSAVATLPKPADDLLTLSDSAKNIPLNGKNISQDSTKCASTDSNILNSINKKITIVEKSSDSTSPSIYFSSRDNTSINNELSDNDEMRSERLMDESQIVKVSTSLPSSIELTVSEDEYEKQRTREIEELLTNVNQATALSSQKIPLHIKRNHSPREDGMALRIDEMLKGANISSVNAPAFKKRKLRSPTESELSSMIADEELHSLLGI